MKTTLLFLSVFLSASLYGQFAQNQANGILAKEFSKEASLYKAKEYLINNVFGIDTALTSFNVDPLAATSSGELTTLIYDCNKKRKSGLLLVFYGNYWNENGVTYQGYGFKNIEEKKALKLFNLLDSKIQKYKSFLMSDSDNKNIYFSFDDMTFLIYHNIEIKIRVFWDNFDSEWQQVAFNRSMKRFKKRANN